MTSATTFRVTTFTDRDGEFFGFSLHHRARVVQTSEAAYITQQDAEREGNIELQRYIVELADMDARPPMRYAGSVSS